MRMLLASAITASLLQAQSAPIAPRPVGTMSELMISLIYPASDAIFYITTRTPSTDVEWNELQAKALTLAETANLLMMPGRARDDGQWMEDAKLMRDAGAAALAAVKRRDIPALEAMNDQLYKSCTTCHQHYRRGYGQRK